MKKYTIDEVKNILIQYNFKLIDDYYINNHQNITYKDEDGYFYFSSLSNLLRGSKPSKFHKSNPYTIQNIKLWLELNNYDYNLVTTEYEDALKKIVLKDNNNYFYVITLANLITGYIPRFVHKRNQYSIKNIKLWCELHCKNFILLSDVYENAFKKLKWKCLKEGCGEVFECDWSHIFLNAGCPYCEGRQVGLSNCLATKNPELAKEWHPIKNGDLTPYDVVMFSEKHIWWLCKECGYEWERTVHHRSKGRNCPQCNKSKGEKRIREWLNLNNIVYEPQKSFNNLVGLGNGNLSYDFYLTDFNVLCEYQGEHHEKPTDFNGRGKKHAKQAFKRQQEHDRRKREYAKNNNIKLLEIWYWDFDNIEKILNNNIGLWAINNIKMEE